MHTNPLPLLIAMLLATTSLANTLTLSDDGIVIDDGSSGKITLRYPRPCDAAKKPVKIAKLAKKSSEIFNSGPWRSWRSWREPSGFRSKPDLQFYCSPSLSQPTCSVCPRQL